MSRILPAVLVATGTPSPSIRPLTAITPRGISGRATRRRQATKPARPRTASDTTNASVRQRGRARSRRTEASLRESEGRFRALFEHASDLIIAAALDGSIIRVNRATEETLQWPREALIGRNIRELITPGSFALGEERMRRVLAGEKLPKIFGLEAIRRDGSVVPLEGWARLLRDARGSPVGHEGVYRDITERRLAEEALRDSEERYRSLFDNASDSILTF